MKKYYSLTIAMLAIATISFSQVDRVSFIETFTSSTCPPCAPANTALEALLAQPANDGKYVSFVVEITTESGTINGDPKEVVVVEGSENIFVVEITTKVGS